MNDSYIKENSPCEVLYKNETIFRLYSELAFSCFRLHSELAFSSTAVMV